MTFTDVISHRFFNALCADIVWPGDLEAERLLPGSETITTWLSTVFPKDMQGRIGYETALQFHAGDVNPYMLQPVVNAANQALAAKADLEAFSQKTHEMCSMIASQADAMRGKLQEQLQQKMIDGMVYDRRVQTTDAWADSKRHEVMRDLARKEGETAGCVYMASQELLGLWIHVQKKIKRKLEHMGTGSQAPFADTQVEEPYTQGDEVQQQMEEELLRQELENSIAIGLEALELAPKDRHIYTN